LPMVRPAYLNTVQVNIAVPSSRAFYGVGRRPLACCDRGFESHRGHVCLSVVSVLSGRGLGDGLITRPEESYRLWRVVSVIKKPRTRGGCKIHSHNGL
jgi:hypothetical protein